MNELKTIHAYVPGKQITLAHLISHPAKELCQKVGIEGVDAMGIMTLTPGETAILAGDVAVKAAAVDIAFLDRFSGTLVVYGSVGSVEQSLFKVCEMLQTVLGYETCPVTRH